MKKRPAKVSAKRISRAALPSKTKVRISKQRTKPVAEAGPVINSRWAWHHRVLTALRDRLIRESTRMQSDASAPIEAHSSHPADSATDEFDHDVALVLLGREQNALIEVTEAIERIRSGTYGVCLETNVPIPAQRLRALPWCRYSREVEERLEKTGRVGRLRVPPSRSLRGPGATLPGTGAIRPEGTDNEPKEADEPNPGTATAEVLRESDESENELEVDRGNR
jgi:RNA polymerase-binding transcription factor DksA